MITLKYLYHYRTKNPFEIEGQMYKNMSLYSSYFPAHLLLSQRPTIASKSQRKITSSTQLN